MLLFRALMSTTLSRGKALLRLTMSSTTPGCGIMAMSGALLAWMLVITRVLMSLTFLNLTVMPFFLASGANTLFKPSMTGWSLLLQIVTVLLLPPLPPPLPHAGRTGAAAVG